MKKMQENIYRSFWRAHILPAEFLLNIDRAGGTREELLFLLELYCATGGNSAFDLALEWIAKYAQKI